MSARSAAIPKGTPLLSRSLGIRSDINASLELLRGSNSSSTSDSAAREELCGFQVKNACSILRANTVNDANIEKATDLPTFNAALSGLSSANASAVAAAIESPPINASNQEAVLKDELLLQGARQVLTCIDVPQLNYWVEARSLKKKKSTATKWQLIDQLLMDIFDLNPPDPSSVPSKRSKKDKDADGAPLEYTPRGAPRPSIDNIVKGVTATKLFDLYNATDLRDFCKKVGLKCTGKKNQLIKSIIAHLDGSEQPAAANEPDKNGVAGDEEEEEEEEEAK